MADFSLSGGVKVTGFISPTDTNDTYAVIDPIYGIDGWRNVDDLIALNAITTERRRAGMIAGVSGGTAYYKLLPEPWIDTISDWEEVFLSQSSTDTFTTGSTLIGTTIYFNTNNALSAYTTDLSSLNITGGSATVEYTNSGSTPTTVGGITAGSTFSAQTMQQMWDLLLYPYQPPSFSSFSRGGLSSIYELGDQVTIGNQTFNWGTTNSSNVNPNTIKIEQLQPSTSVLLSGSTNDGSELINLTTTISSNSSTSLSLYRITATNSEASNFTSTISGSWRPRWYHGRYTGSTIPENIVTGGTLTTALVSSVVNNFISFTAGSGYLYLVVPDSLGQPSDFRDSVAGCFGTNVPFTTLPDLTFNNAFGVSQTYKQYRSVNQILGASNVWLCS